MVLARAVGAENYIGYEANPELMPDALENFQNNGMKLNYHTAVLRNRVRGGVGDPVNFYINKDFWVSALTPSGSSIRTVQVPVLCLEDEMEKFQANALMMDIEGGECELLLYADLSGINKIFMEIHYWPSREAADKMIRYLVTEGFDFNLPFCYGHSIALVRH
jgi:FkbM family methyltransferase